MGDSNDEPAHTEVRTGDAVWTPTMTYGVGLPDNADVQQNGLWNLDSAGSLEPCLTPHPPLDEPDGIELALSFSATRVKTSGCLLGCVPRPFWLTDDGSLQKGVFRSNLRRDRCSSKKGLVHAEWKAKTPRP